MLLLSAHFPCMEIIGKYIGEHYRSINIVYQKHKNNFLESFITGKRNCYFSNCIQRKNVLGIVKSLKNKKSIWYAPDQDFKQKRNIFIPFFKQKCSSLTTTSWLITTTKSIVVPCYYIRKKDLKGYDIYILPSFKKFPSKNNYNDGKRYNEMIEKITKQNPSQYLWQHRRYKTRAIGIKNYYKF